MLAKRRTVDRLAVLQWLAVLVPAVCAGLYETVRHSLLASELPNALGTVLAVALVLSISSAFARVAFGMIRQTEARLRERNRQLQALSRRVERLAVAEERDRLAREMHDGVAQALASLLVRVDTVQGLLERGRTDDAAGALRQMRDTGAAAYADVREAIADLRTRPEAGAAGLAAALDQYVCEFGDRAGVEAIFTAAGLDQDARGVPAGPHEMTPVAEMQLLRVAQEALANVRKHAAASRVLVRLEARDDGWSLDVRDDGVGFDPSATSTVAGRRHFGLSIMRERMQGLGGTLDVHSAAGAGTTIYAHVPHAAAAQSAMDGGDGADRGDDAAGREASAVEEEGTGRGAAAAAAG